MKGANQDISLVDRTRKAAYWGNDSSFARESISLTYEETLPELHRNPPTKHISRWESDLFGVPPPHRRSKMFRRQMRRRNDLFPKVDLLTGVSTHATVIFGASRRAAILTPFKSHLRPLSLNINFIVGFERHLRPPSSHSTLTFRIQSDALRVRERRVRDKAPWRRGKRMAVMCGWLPAASPVPSRTILICQAELILN